MTALVVVSARILLVPFAGELAPYAFNFAGVVIAAVLAGWRGGLTALVAAQLLAWYIIVEPHWSFAITHRDDLGGLVVATLAQLLILAVVAAYQREVAKGWSEREKRVELLDEALREIDHRTRNNYQTVLALVELQGRRARDEGVKVALLQVAERIQAISNASRQLAVQSAELGGIRLDNHLCTLVDQIERGLSREEIEVECNVDDVTASPDKATSISIIVNELVTNAIKHAFNGERSGHVWVTGKGGSAFELIVSDDGRGIEAARTRGRSGLGTKLVESFARQLGAQHQVTSTDQGTTHRLVIPNLV